MSEHKTPRTALYSRGLEVRRAVLGADYVDQSIASADSFTGPFQTFVTEWCWGEIWNRPGLDRRMRSTINLAVLTALNRPAELRLHVRGALNNGVTHDEIREILLHTAVYCGIPAALDSFKVARAVIADDQTPSST